MSVSNSDEVIIKDEECEMCVYNSDEVIIKDEESEMSLSNSLHSGPTD
jgi:C4-type Zn-finger protein